MASITPAQIGLIARKANPLYVTAFEGDQDALADAGILASDLRVCHFMAQVLTETGDLGYTAEDLDYSAATICREWPKHFLTLADAAPYDRNPEALGNYIYGPTLNGKTLGNTDPGDGYKFRGRGLLQITGRAAYQRVGDALGLDLIGDPDLAFDPRYSLAVAANVWSHNTYAGKSCNVLADADDVRGVTLAINGGLNGLPDRTSWLAKAKQIWRGGAPAQAPVAPALAPSVAAAAAPAATRPGPLKTIAAAGAGALFTAGVVGGLLVTPPSPPPAQALVPLTSAGHPVRWWMAFKLNQASSPTQASDPRRLCPFGGTVFEKPFGQQYLYAASDNRQLRDGPGLIGTSTDDPVGATFSQIYKGSYHYVVWNDQFYNAPKIAGCSTSCGEPWGHSKGVIAWDDTGAGVVMQVTTPDWPGSGSASHPRQGDGNTLGCTKDDDILLSQQFFSLALSKDDLVKVLRALVNASVVTDPSNPQLVSNGGPTDVMSIVGSLGRTPQKKGGATQPTVDVLSSGVELISKPSDLNVAPWQLVSAELGGAPLKVLSDWSNPGRIPSTGGTRAPACWSPSLRAPGAVAIATSGMWDGKSIGFMGGPSGTDNHAKIGISTSGDHAYSIFGDMNQQGALAPPTPTSTDCGAAQNARGGLFFVIDDATLNQGLTSLMNGAVAPLASGT